MKRITMLLAAFGLMLASYTSASACVCDLPLKRVSLKKAIAKAKSEAEVVFSGQVIELDDSIVKFRVERLWKGTPAEEIVLTNTGMGKAPSGDRIISSCAYNFRMGEKYLVYAYGSEGKLQTHKCTRTAVSEDAVEDYMMLENLAPKKKVRALLLAASANEVDRVKELLRHGVNVNAADKSGETALMVGAHHPEMVKLLLEAGADVNAKNKFGATALMYTMLDYRDGTKLLLAAGADVNARDRDGKTALMVAVYDGRVDKIKMLVDAGADVNARDKARKSVLMYAAERNQADAIKILKEAGAIQ
jgi:hypothetical protein